MHNICHGSAIFMKRNTLTPFLAEHRPNRRNPAASLLWIPSLVSLLVIFVETRSMDQPTSTNSAAFAQRIGPEFGERIRTALSMRACWCLLDPFGRFSGSKKNENRNLWPLPRCFLYPKLCQQDSAVARPWRCRSSPGHTARPRMEGWLKFARILLRLENLTMIQTTNNIYNEYLSLNLLKHVTRSVNVCASQPFHLHHGSLCSQLAMNQIGLICIWGVKYKRHKQNDQND